jgi:hypothetical protein
MDQDAHAKIVHIIPIITRANGTEIAELGAGGGKGDLDQKEELQMGGIADLQKLMELCVKTIQDEQLLSKVLGLLHQSLAQSNDIIDLDMQMRKVGAESQDGLTLQKLVAALSANASRSIAIEEPQNRKIRFPYSRHSSYSELCELVDTFKPSDVFPCTFDEEEWEPTMSMQSLFGEYCNADTFRHDIEMMQLCEARIQRQRLAKRDREETQDSTQVTDDELPRSPIAKRMRDVKYRDPDQSKIVVPLEMFNCAKPQPIVQHGNMTSDELSSASSKSQSDVGSQDKRSSIGPATADDPDIPRSSSKSPGERDSRLRLNTIASGPSMPSLLMPSPNTVKLKRKDKRLTNRQLAYNAAIGTHLTWADFGGLTSTRPREERDECEL